MTTTLCDFDCDRPAEYVAGQSHDLGATVTYALTCAGHVEGWNAEGEWDAPVLPIALYGED